MRVCVHKSAFFMYAISRLLNTVHDFNMKSDFTTPKIYTGGVAISEWHLLSKTQKSEALSKQWYVYYSFRNPETKQLVRQPNVKQ